jgi:hypothetical protein
MQIGTLLAVLFAFVLVLFGLILTPLILDQSAETQGNTYVNQFPGVSSLIGLVPLIVVVGLIALAGVIAFVAIKNQGKIAGGGTGSR